MHGKTAALASCEPCKLFEATVADFKRVRCANVSHLPLKSNKAASLLCKLTAAVTRDASGRRREQQTT